MFNNTGIIGKLGTADVRHAVSPSAMSKASLRMCVALCVFALPAWGAGVDDDINSQRRYDQVAYLTAHNAFASSDEGWVYAQQKLSIPNQLGMGVRGLMLDIHWAQGGLVEQQCNDVKEPVTEIENQCKKETHRVCKDVEKTKEVCEDVSEQVCDWLPIGKSLCKTVTKQVCKPVKYVENECSDVLEEVCTPISVTKWVTNTVCNVTNVAPGGDWRVRLCHEKEKGTNCVLTRTVLYPLHVSHPLADALIQIRQFLDNNRKSIVTIFFESYVGDKGRVDREFADSGINKYLFDQEAWFAAGPNNKPKNLYWPTIQQMRDSNKRLVVLTGKGLDDRPNNWNYVVETQYDLRQYSGCEIRGETKDNKFYNASDPKANDPKVSLFTMNHFYEISPGQPFAADLLAVNRYDKLSARVKKCQAEIKHIPNFIAIDFVESGDGLRVIKELNK